MISDEEWIDAVLSLALSARTNTGVSDEEVEKALNSMDHIRSKYKGQPSIPSKIVNILIDMQSTLIASAERHEIELGNDLMAQKIYHVTFALASMALDMTDTGAQ